MDGERGAGNNRAGFERMQARRPRTQERTFSLPNIRPAGIHKVKQPGNTTMPILSRNPQTYKYSPPSPLDLGGTND